MSGMDGTALIGRDSIARFVDGLTQYEVRIRQDLDRSAQESMLKAADVSDLSFQAQLAKRLGGKQEMKTFLSVLPEAIQTLENLILEDRKNSLLGDRCEELAQKAWHDAIYTTYGEQMTGNSADPLQLNISNDLIAVLDEYFNAFIYEVELEWNSCLAAQQGNNRGRG